MFEPRGVRGKILPPRSSLRKDSPGVRNGVQNGVDYILLVISDVFQYSGNVVIVNRKAFLHQFPKHTPCIDERRPISNGGCDVASGTRQKTKKRHRRYEMATFQPHMQVANLKLGVDLLLICCWPDNTN